MRTEAVRQAHWRIQIFWQQRNWKGNNRPWVHWCPAPIQWARQPSYEEEDEATSTWGIQDLTEPFPLNKTGPWLFLPKLRQWAWFLILYSIYMCHSWMSMTVIIIKIMHHFGRPLWVFLTKLCNPLSRMLKIIHISSTKREPLSPCQPGKTTIFRLRRNVPTFLEKSLHIHVLLGLGFVLSTVYQGKKKKRAGENETRGKTGGTGMLKEVDKRRKGRTRARSSWWETRTDKWKTTAQKVMESSIN